MKNTYGYTLIEIVIVMGIIAVLLASVSFALIPALDKAALSQAVSDTLAIEQAVNQYHADMGFYPPDTNRGVDPGLGCKPNSPGCAQYTDALGNITICDVSGTQNCPIGFNMSTVTNKWKEPYTTWPDKTPWGGEYDYDYWPSPSGRPCGAGISSPVPGIFISIRSAIDGTGKPKKSIEQSAIASSGDGDRCGVPNGEIMGLFKQL
jgi:prepilin-type N-terminal cleavage/methylation domain-containing protein